VVKDSRVDYFVFKILTRTLELWNPRVLIDIVLRRMALTEGLSLFFVPDLQACIKSRLFTRTLESSNP